MVKRSGSRKQKHEVLQYLRTRDLDGIISWTGENESALRRLFLFTFSNDDTIRWRAVEAIGKAAKVVSESNVEKVRDFIRRLFWLMNDESGGIGWYAPEVIGEILFNNPFLLGEYGRLLPQYLSEEPFERGTHFALARLSALDPDLIVKTDDALVWSLNNFDPAIRGYSIMALSMLKTDAYTEYIVKRIQDKSVFTSFDFYTGKLFETSVGQIAESAVQRLLPAAI